MNRKLAKTGDKENKYINTNAWRETKKKFSVLCLASSIYNEKYSPLRVFLRRIYGLLNRQENLEILNVEQLI